MAGTRAMQVAPQFRRPRVVRMFLDTLSYRTRERLELINITGDVNQVVRRRGLRTGIAIIQSLHTTTSIFINEFQQALLDDIKSFLNRLVGRFDYWRHNDPCISECSRQNADAHLRAMLLGHTLSLPVQRNELALGGWQSVILAELDGPRERAVQVQVIGETDEAELLLEEEPG